MPETVPSSPNQMLPVATPTASTTPPKKSKGKWLILVALFTLLLGVGLTIVYITWQQSITPNSGGNNNNTSTVANSSSNYTNSASASSTPSATASRSATAYSGGTVKDLYNENVEVNKPPRIIDRPELNIMLEAVKLSIQANWDGDIFTDVPISYSQFDAANVQRLLNAQKEIDVITSEVPDQLEYIFSDSEATEGIQASILNMWQEYVDYLQSKGVADKYIAELTQHTLPQDPERIIYRGFDSDRWPYHEPFVNRETFEKDHRQSIVHLYDNAAYYYAMRIVDSGILGPEPQAGTQAYTDFWQTARDMSLRMTVFHEMTHALQVAYIYVNAGDDFYQAEKYWQASPTKLSDVASKFFWDWDFDEHFGKGEFNRVIGDESTADTVCFAMTVDLYNLSQNQQKLLWDYNVSGEIMKLVAQQTDDMKVLFRDNYPKLNPSQFANSLRAVFQQVEDTETREFLLKYVIDRIATQRGMSAAIGYGHGLTIEELDPMWEMLRK